MSYLDQVSKKMGQKKKQLQSQRLNNNMKLSVQNTANDEKSKAGRRKSYIKSAIVAKTNTSGNVRNGKSYFESYDAKKGGYWHTYDNGKRIFVRKTPKHSKTETTTLPKKGQTGGSYKYLNRSQSSA